MLVIVSAVLPVLVSVLVCGGGGHVRVGDVWQLKDKLDGESLTTVPVPLRVIVCTLFGELSVTFKAAVRGPRCLG